MRDTNGCNHDKESVCRRWGGSPSRAAAHGSSVTNAAWLVHAYQGQHVYCVFLSFDLPCTLFTLTDFTFSVSTAEVANLISVFSFI